MRNILLIALVVLIPASSTHSETTPSAPYWEQWYGETKLLIDLLTEGYEIKASIHLRLPTSGDAEILYVQKGPSAYRCLAFDVEGVL